MGIKRYVAFKDNTITNAFKADLTTRGTGSNMGLADSVEIFSIYAQETSSSNEQTRTLVQFPVSALDTTDYPNSGLTTIEADRTAGKIPPSGSVNFYLKLYNVATAQTVPREFTLVVKPVSGALAVSQWQEGTGLDMENYSDQTYNGTGSNWMNRAANTPWVAEGGDFLATRNYKQFFDTGIEDLEIDITTLVEDWVTGSAGSGIPNGGVGIMLTASQASGSDSYYTKKFSARGSEYFFNRPIIEARWDSSKKDNRGNFVVSSSVLSSTDNLMTIYFYNYFRTQPTDLPNVGVGSINVSVYNSSSGGTVLTTTPAPMPVTGGWVATGIYSASFALSTTASVVYDRWWSGSAGVAITDASVVTYHTGAFKPKSFQSSNIYSIPRYITAITNFQPKYCRDDLNRFRVYTRLKNWNVTNYVVAQAAPQVEIVDNAYYKVYRTIDNKTVIDYGTGSLNHTRLSYDASGSYFDFDMSMLLSGYEYGFNFVYYINGAYEEQPDTFTFRVE